jgi:hypothetical protein
MVQPGVVGLQLRRLISSWCRFRGSAVETISHTKLFPECWSTAAYFSIVVHLRVGQQDISLNRAKRERRCSGCETLDGIRVNSLQDGVQEQLVMVTENTQPRQIGDAHAALISSPRMHPLSCHVRKGDQRAPRNTSRCVMPQPVEDLSRVLLQSAPFRVAAPFPFTAISRISAPFSSNQLLFRVVRPVPSNAMSPSVLPRTGFGINYSNTNKYH